MRIIKIKTEGKLKVLFRRLLYTFFWSCFSFLYSLNFTNFESSSQNIVLLSTRAIYILSISVILSSLHIHVYCIVTFLVMNQSTNTNCINNNNFSFFLIDSLNIIETKIRMYLKIFTSVYCFESITLSNGLSIEFHQHASVLDDRCGSSQYYFVILNYY